MKILTFYKNENGTWYVDLPDWKGDNAELMMVAGADTLLDLIAKKESTVGIEVSLHPFDGASQLKLDHKDEPGCGGYYKLEKLGNEVLNHDLWLCHVTSFVFGFIPDAIYIKPLSSDGKI